MENRSGLEFLGSDSEYDVVEGLTTWEFINPSDDDDDAVDFSFSSEDENDVIGPKSEGAGPNPSGSLSSSDDVVAAMKSVNYLVAVDGGVIGLEVEGPVGNGPIGSDQSVNYLLALGDGGVIGLKEEGPVGNGPIGSDQSLNYQNYLLALENEEYVSEDDEEDEEEEYEDEYDLDDELVPNGVRGRIGRERIKKLGKRGGYSRMKKAKKLPYYYNRPGCVHGKHGLGVQHSYI